MSARPLLYLVVAEKRVAGIVSRDFKAEPWKTGEGVTFFNEERLLRMKQDNEELRKRRGRK